MGVTVSAYVIVQVMFQPRSTESCCEQFIIKPRGGISNVTIRCTGRGQGNDTLLTQSSNHPPLEGADVEIMESFINFGNIACGTSTAHVLRIKNNSQTVKAAYQVSMSL